MIPRFAVRTLASILFITSMAGVQAMHAQAVPQLLPYQIFAVAGGGPTFTFTAGATCPVSGKTSVDAFGDGCLATEVTLIAPKYVTEDAAGNVYFSDSGNKLIRRVDAVTGIITTVAGGGTVALPAGTACPSNSANKSSDFQGDGCLATDVKLGTPTGVAVAPLGLVSSSVVSVSPGDIVFADVSNSTVRGISSKTGTIYNIAGNVTGASATYGYGANTASVNVNEGGTGTAPNVSSLDAPYGLHFDSVGNLYIAEEYKDAILVANTSSVPTIVTGVTIPAGTIAKIAGFKNATDGAYCPNGTGGSAAACGYGLWTSGTSANLNELDNSYDVTTDASGNVYVASEYYPAVAKINATTGILTTWAGKQSAVATIANTRGLATSVSIGSNYGVAADAVGNVYISDSYTGWIWRVDAANQGIYVLAGSTPLASVASEPCHADTYGDGCPASGTYFPTGTITATGTPAHPTSTVAISGLYVDAAGTLLIANTAGNMVHKITTNANFGNIQPTYPVQNIQIHFGAGDGPSTYNLTTNPSNFSLGTANCGVINSDTTQDCILPITASPGAAGAFSSNLQVVSALGQTGNFTLSGFLTLDQAASSTSLTLSATSTNPVTPVTLTAAVTPATSSPVTGTITFFSNGVQIGTPQNLTTGSKSASIQQTFPVGSYSITAEYSGNLFLFGSTSTSSAAATITSVVPAFNIAPNTPSMTVAQGQYGINSFAITTSGSYTGTVSFACSGLPANASCSFSPSSLAVGGTGAGGNTVSLNIVTGATNHAALVKPADPRAGYKTLLVCLLPGAAGMMLVGFGRAKRTRLLATSLTIGMLLIATGLTGCSSSQSAVASTPAGSYTVTVTATGTPNVVSTSTNIVQTSTLTLNVTGY